MNRSLHHLFLLKHMQTTNYTKKMEKNPLSQIFLRNFDHQLIKEIKALKPTSIIDVGCGEGFTLNKLMQSRVSKKYLGIEYMDDAITLGKKLHPQVPIQKGDIYKLKQKSKSYDVVLCSEVLEHLENPEKALQELKRVSKRYVVLSVPYEPFFTFQRILRGKNLIGLGAHPEHQQYWTANSFQKFVGQQLSVVKVLTPLPWVLIIAKK